MFAKTWDIVIAVCKLHILVQLADPIESKEQYTEVKGTKHASSVKSATKNHIGVTVISKNSYDLLRDDNEMTEENATVSQDEVKSVLTDEKEHEKVNKEKVEQKVTKMMLKSFLKPQQSTT